MFRDVVNKLTLRKKLILLASVGVLFPLLVLTYLQYRSLTELQNKTKGAFKDNLRQGLTVVEFRMKRRLEDIAAQAFNPLGSIDLSSPGAAEEIEKHSANIKRSHPEIEELFVNSRDPQKTNNFERARMAQSFLDRDRKYLFADGKYLFYPVNDPTKKEFVGVSLTERFVSDDLIAKGLKAGDWIRETAKVAGGGGGGRPQMAQAGGKDPSKLGEALETAKKYAYEKVGG